jgi:hypothetical protein
LSAITPWSRVTFSAPSRKRIYDLTAGMRITVFDAQGDKAYLAGFTAGKTKSGDQVPDIPLNNMQIIKENGQWKWCGDKK